ncbi:hypothetical protein NFX46_17280 [Streptomyces phaeoluteigriseus]|uniref:Uncharacterized protein n=1 Tax=Streptomyces phaeoluteigriseus TaxID=114686 RepID=A0ABY4Z9K7_9ACTN|nr:hypothetical protein [Streptomyces phaeoluteigriseus]USQ85380.1 hypothetical protein NFX46_17280 [Streptomyces phaeoluteigriseus]
MPEPASCWAARRSVTRVAMPFLISTSALTASFLVAASSWSSVHGASTLAPAVPQIVPAP